MPVIAPMTVADLDAAMLIERQSFKQPWSRHMYLSDLQNNRLATYLVLRPGPLGIASTLALPDVLAYGGFWLMVDEAHIATIASHPDWRGCGLGELLLLGLLDAAVERGAVSSTLEVRVSNGPARQLYDKLGYQIAGVRRHYYQDGENALIMTTPPLASPDMIARRMAGRASALARWGRCQGRPAEA